jgi:type I restriction enzyme S subunit
MSEPAVFESNMMRLALDLKRARPEYVLLALMSPQGRCELQRNAKHAVNQSSINQEDVRSVDLQLPPIPDQDRIVTLVTQMFSLAETVEHRVQKAASGIEKAPPAILSRAFSGELVPTEAELARAEGRTYETAEELLARIRAQRGMTDEKGVSASRRAARRGRRAIAARR